jgi:hypothetical protein
MKDSLKGYTDIEQLIILYLMDHGQAKIKDIQNNKVPCWTKLVTVFLIL